MTMKKRTVLFLFTFLSIFPMLQISLSAQEDPEKAAKAAKKYMQEAEAALAENDMATAEAYYRQAIAKDPENAEARYNLGNLYYNNEITGEAVQRHSQSAKVAEEKPLKHNSFHNQGNAFMKQKKYKEAVEAYKNALRNDPGDEETRYNYALAKKMLEEEKKGGGEDDNQQDKDQQDQDQEQKQDQKDQQGDEGEKEKNDEGKPQDDSEGGEEDKQDKKEGEDKKDDEGKPQDQDKQQPQEGSEEEQQKQPQPRPGQLSPQQVKNLLEAMGNEEKKVQEKVNAEKVKGAKTKTEKDW